MTDVSTADEARPYRNKRDDGVARVQIWAWVSPEIAAAIEADMKRKNQTRSAATGDALGEHYGIKP